MFSPDEVKRLPDHQPYNINIELEDGKTPPFGPIYSLSQDERKALFEYIEHNLEKGFIQHSTLLSCLTYPFYQTKNWRP